MHALHDVVKAGYARYIGMSNCLAWQFHVMQNYAIANHLTPFISMQNHHNLVYREDEREMFPTLKVSVNGYAVDLYPFKTCIFTPSTSALESSRGRRLPEVT
jgi:diketogulonate reductase-like aldo/keto reductase